MTSMLQDAEPESSLGGINRSTILAWKLSAAILLAVAILWAGSRVRPCGDTRIALAAGRLICERGYFNFPLEDEFSFTFSGEVWTNQNWLGHVIYWWVYHHWCPSGLVALKLASALLLGLVAWRSALLLSNDGPLALLAASWALFCVAQLIDIRPNLMGLVCVSLLYWNLLLLKHGRAWVMWLIPPLMTFWGNAHGSFMFGFIMLGVYLCAEAGQHILKQRTILTPWKHLLWLGLASFVSAILIAVTSPYHLSNFTHPLVITASVDRAVFQRMFEWRPPHSSLAHWPQVVYFWILIAVSIVIWILAAIRGRPSPPGSDEQVAAAGPKPFDATEILFAVIGLYLGLKHLRFIPYFVFLSLPVTCKLLAAAWGKCPPTPTDRPRQRRPFQPRAMTLITGLNIALIIYFAGIYNGELRRAYLPDSDEPYTTWLFNRHICHEIEPTEMVAFARRCGLSGPVLNDWGWGGYLMFQAPQFKVFIDGRAQALYSPAHCRRYFRLTDYPAQDPPPDVSRGREIDRELTSLGVNLLLSQRTPKWAANIVKPLLETHFWHPLFETGEGILLVNGMSNDPATIRLMDKYWAGELDWPDTSHGWQIRGYVHQNGPQPDYPLAIEAYRRAIELAPQPWVYDSMLICWRKTGRLGEAVDYLRAQRRRLVDLLESSPQNQEQLTQCVQTLDAMLTNWKPADP